MANQYTPNCAMCTSFMAALLKIYSLEKASVPMMAKKYPFNLSDFILPLKLGSKNKKN
jgi:hypothetical protein